MKRITTKEAVDLILGAEHEFFTVSFIKRTNGEVRVMNCRRNVSKHISGGGRAYEFEERGLLPVWDTKIKEGGAAAYRCIPTESLLTLRINGEEYTIEQKMG